MLNVTLNKRQIEICAFREFLCPTTRTDLPALICGAIPDARWRTSQNPTGGSVQQLLMIFQGKNMNLRHLSGEKIPFSQGNAKMWRHA